MKMKPLGKVKTFSRVVVREVANPDADDDDRALVGMTFAVWTDSPVPRTSWRRMSFADSSRRMAAS